MREYQPSPEEIAAAEAMMTKEYEEASEVRARYWEQARAPWESFDSRIDENYERRPPTETEAAEMDQRVKQLGEVMGDSPATWTLDGALNISLMKGKYIGYHKDVDISVEKNQLAELEAHLEQKGYGLFLSLPNKSAEGGHIMRRVSYLDFAQPVDSSIAYIIAAIDEQGKIKEDEPLNYIDVHVVNRNDQDQPVGVSGMALPEKWFEPQPIEKDGSTINLSHPAKVVYYKLHINRNYDVTDLDRLAETSQ